MAALVQPVDAVRQEDTCHHYPLFLGVFGEEGQTMKKGIRYTSCWQYDVNCTGRVIGVPNEETGGTCTIVLLDEIRVGPTNCRALIMTGAQGMCLAMIQPAQDVAERHPCTSTNGWDDRVILAGVVAGFSFGPDGFQASAVAGCEPMILTCFVSGRIPEGTGQVNCA